MGVPCPRVDWVGSQLLSFVYWGTPQHRFVHALSLVVHFFILWVTSLNMQSSFTHLLWIFLENHILSVGVLISFEVIDYPPQLATLTTCSSGLANNQVLTG